MQLLGVFFLGKLRLRIILILLLHNINVSVSPRTNSQHHCVYQLNILAIVFKELKEVEIIPTTLMIARKNIGKTKQEARERGGGKEV